MNLLERVTVELAMLANLSKPSLHEIICVKYLTSLPFLEREVAIILQLLAEVQLFKNVQIFGCLFTN